MAWFEVLREIEPFDELLFDAALVELLEIAAREKDAGAEGGRKRFGWLY